MLPAFHANRIEEQLRRVLEARKDLEEFSAGAMTSSRDWGDDDTAGRLYAGITASCWWT